MARILYMNFWCLPTQIKENTTIRFSCFPPDMTPGTKNVFAENLKYYMDEKGVSRREVSEALGVSYFTFTSWVNGKKYPRMDKVEMLADYFGIQKSDLIEENKKPVIDDGLTESQKKLIDFAKSLSEEQADKVLQLMQSILAFDE